MGRAYESFLGCDVTDPEMPKRLQGTIRPLSASYHEVVSRKLAPIQHSDKQNEDFLLAKEGGTVAARQFRQPHTVTK